MPRKFKLGRHRKNEERNRQAARAKSRAIACSEPSNGSSYISAYTSDQRRNAFSDRDLPIHQGNDTTVLGEKEQQNVIASSDKPVMIPSGRGLLIQYPGAETSSDTETSGCKETFQRNRESCAYLQLLATASQHGKLCGGGNGGSSSSNVSQPVSFSSQNAHGSSSLVVGVGCSSGGGGLGGAGDGDDEDPNNYHSNIPPSHYNDFKGYEEQSEKMHRNVAVIGLSQEMVGNQLLQYFQSNQGEPLSVSLNGKKAESEDRMEWENEGAPTSFDQFYADLCDPIVPAEGEFVDGMNALDKQLLGEEVEPLADDMDTLTPSHVPSHSPESTQDEEMHDDLASFVPDETLAASLQNTQFDISPTAEKSSSNGRDSLCMTKPCTLRIDRQGQKIGLTQHTNSIPPSQMNVHPTSTPPFPPSHVDPFHSLSPLGTHVPLTQTPPTSLRWGPLLLESFISDKKRVCELSVAPNLPPSDRDVALKMLKYVTEFYFDVTCCNSRLGKLDLKIANDMHMRAVMCDYSSESQGLKFCLSMPHHCKQLSVWLEQNSDQKDHLLVLQQVLNTLVAIHTINYEKRLTLWGSFMVWVASDLRVYLLVDFPKLLQKQLQAASDTNPCLLDVMTLKEIYTEMGIHYSGRNNYWNSPELSHVLELFEQFFSYPPSECRMAEHARLLGERRVCKIGIDGLSIVLFCLEGEKLRTALSVLSKIAPSRISRVWTVQSMTSGDFMRVGDIATADRPMHLCLKPCMHPSDAKLLYVVCEDSG